MFTERRSALRRLARLCYSRRRIVLAGWVLGLLALLAVAGAAAGTFEDDFELPGSESQAAVDLLESSGFSTRAGFQGQLVIAAEAGVRDPAVQRPVEALLGGIEANVPDVTVASPYDEGGRFQISPDGTIAFADLALADRSDGAYADAVDEIRALVAQADAPNVQLELGGDRFAEQAEGGSEAIGMLAAVVILLVAFGSVLAMGLPLLTALFGIGGGAAVVVSSPTPSRCRASPSSW